jgi:hypothetical protein
MAVTREQLEKALGVDKKPFNKVKDIDYDYVAISILRGRIPQSVCRQIISGARHDMILLCTVDEAVQYLKEEDLPILADCNVGVDDFYCGCLTLFV